MRSSITIGTAAWLASGLATAVSASGPLATFTPCPDCPAGVAPAPITITSQYQAVSTCTPSSTCLTKTAKAKGKAVASLSCNTVPSCSTYDWVSTVIPCWSDGSSSFTVTETDEIVPAYHESTVYSSVIPCPTQAPHFPSWNGTNPKHHNATTTCVPQTSYTTVVTDYSCPFNEIGPLGIPGYGGSGLCEICGPLSDGSVEQIMTVTDCTNAVCQTAVQTWVSTKAAPTTSVSSAKVSGSSYCSTNGPHTIPMSCTVTPTNPAYTPVTVTSYYTTTVTNAPTPVECSSTVPVTFTAPPSSRTSESTAPVSTSTFCSTNGVHTIPITTTCQPTNPAYSTPVTTTVYYTTTVTNAPTTIGCTTTITITFTETTCPVKTIVSGSTITTHSSTSTSGPASTSCTTTTSSHGSTSSGPTRSTSTSASSTSSSSPTPTPSDPPVIGTWDFVGCLGSHSGFPSFTLVDTDASMSINMCINECQASDYTYAGVYVHDCYCANSVSGTTDLPDSSCELPCPGNPQQACGGNAGNWNNRGPPYNINLDVYENSPTTTTTSSTTSTTSGQPDHSSEPDPEEEKRDIHADMDMPHRFARDSPKLRRGGLVRSPNKVEQSNNRQKRDLGLKKPFGH